MGILANEMAIELFYKLKQQIKAKTDAKRQEQQEAKDKPAKKKQL